MKVKFLGTAAAEGIPALFCNCDNCKHARIYKGKNIRTRFSILIDEDYKIDFPPDSYMHLLNYNLDYLKLNHIFITHDHSDHFSPNELGFLTKYFTRVRNHKLNIYGNEFVIESLEKRFPKDDPNYPNMVSLKYFDYFETESYDITCLPADHNSRGKPFMYFFEEKSTKKTFLCAHDTGYFPEETWNFLKNKKIDLISLDGTALCFNQTKHHLGFDGIKLVKERLEKEKIINDKTVFVINHFSHNPQMNHQQIEDYVKDMDILVAYDGMEIDI